MQSSSKTVLLVDDGQDERLLFDRAAKKACVSFEMRFATDGEDALAYLSGTGPYADRGRFQMPDLVVLDLNMPRMTGFEVLEWIRKHPHLRELPVIMFTASNHHTDIKRAYELTANSYLVKPMSLIALVDTITMIDAYWVKLSCLPKVGLYSP
ncbi:MAG: response regulator [Rariglobus sp.]